MQLFRCIYFYYIFLTLFLSTTVRSQNLNECVVSVKLNQKTSFVTLEDDVKKYIRDNNRVRVEVVDLVKFTTEYYKSESLMRNYTINPGLYLISFTTLEECPQEQNFFESLMNNFDSIFQQQNKRIAFINRIFINLNLGDALKDSALDATIRDPKKGLKLLASGIVFDTSLKIIKEALLQIAIKRGSQWSINFLSRNFIAETFSNSYVQAGVVGFLAGVAGWIDYELWKCADEEQARELADQLVSEEEGQKLANFIVESIIMGSGMTLSNKSNFVRSLTPLSNFVSSSEYSLLNSQISNANSPLRIYASPTTGIPRNTHTWPKVQKILEQAANVAKTGGGVAHAGSSAGQRSIIVQEIVSTSDQKIMLRAKMNYYDFQKYASDQGNSIYQYNVNANGFSVGYELNAEWRKIANKLFKDSEQNIYQILLNTERSNNSIYNEIVIEFIF